MKYFKNWIFYKIGLFLIFLVLFQEIFTNTMKYEEKFMIRSRICKNLDNSNNCKCKKNLREKDNKLIQSNFIEKSQDIKNDSKYNCKIIYKNSFCWGS